LQHSSDAVVAPIHPKAMPVILTTPEEVDLWLEGVTPDALKLQRPSPDEFLRILARGEKEDPPPLFTRFMILRVCGRRPATCSQPTCRHHCRVKSGFGLIGAAAFVNSDLHSR
jgi:hypothetical protein